MKLVGWSFLNAVLSVTGGHFCNYMGIWCYILMKVAPPQPRYLVAHGNEALSVDEWYETPINFLVSKYISTETLTIYSGMASTFSMPNMFLVAEFSHLIWRHYVLRRPITRKSVNHLIHRKQTDTRHLNTKFALGGMPFFLVFKVGQWKWDNGRVTPWLIVLLLFYFSSFY